MINRNQLFDQLLKRSPKPSLEQANKIKTTTSGLPINRNDVVCVRGKAYWDHEGNQIYRKLIECAKTRYSNASNRFAKSMIVSEIIDAVHRSGARFTKKVGKGKISYWVECKENFVREKVTQSLRDALSFKYSSSTKRKKERKAMKVQEEKIHGNIDEIVQSNIAVSYKINSLRQNVEYVNHIYGNDILDETILEIMDMGNQDILETIKKERSMLNQFDGVTNGTKNALSTTVNNKNPNHYRKNSEGSYSSSSIPLPQPQFSYNSSIASSAYSTSSSYTTASSCLSTSPSTAATSDQYNYESFLTLEKNNSHYDEEVVLDLDASFMFLDDMNAC